MKGRLKKTLESRLVIWACLAAILLINLFLDTEVISQTICSNGDCVVRAALSAYALIPAGIALILLFVLGHLPAQPAQSGAIKKRHVMTAWVVDFLLILTALGPLIAAVILMIEAAHTGQWAGFFERHSVRATDLAPVLVVLASIAPVILYLGRGGRGRGPTIGQYLLRFEAKVDPGIPAWRRVLGVAFLPAQIVLRPIEATVGTRRAPALSFAEIELTKIE